MANLIDHMGKRFSESEVKGLMLQLLAGVEHLHEHWIIHRDIKMSNLLYTNQVRLGSARQGQELWRVEGQEGLGQGYLVMEREERGLPVLVMGERVMVVIVELLQGCVS